MHQSTYKPLLIFLSFVLSIALLMFYTSPLEKLNWGSWDYYNFDNAVPFIMIVLLLSTVFFFQREIKLAKTQQQNEDYREFNSILGKELNILKELVRGKNFAEDKIEEIWKEIKDKVRLSQIHELPELAIILIEKIVNIKDEFGVKFHTQIDGDLSSLRKLNMDDLRQTINIMLSPLCENFKVVDIENRGDINLFIREYDNRVSLKIMHDYIDPAIPTEMTEWKIKKLLNKYGANISITHEKEDNTLILMITVDIPKEIKTKKVI